MDVPHDYREVGADIRYYFFQSTVHRFLALFAVIHQFEAEALYVDSRIADENDYEFVKFTRAMLWTAIGPDLFSGLHYDAGKARDHFLKDDLRRACDHGWVGDGEAVRFMSLDELREMMGKEEWLNSTLNFFKDLRANEENRYRWDRLVALHLILLAFVEDFGHSFQSPSDQRIRQVVEQFDTSEVPQNLLNWLPTLGLMREDDSERWKPRYWVQILRRDKESGIQKIVKPLNSVTSD